MACPGARQPQHGGVSVSRSTHPSPGWPAGGFGLRDEAQAGALLTRGSRPLPPAPGLGFHLPCSVAPSLSLLPVRGQGRARHHGVGARGAELGSSEGLPLPCLAVGLQPCPVPGRWGRRPGQVRVVMHTEPANTSGWPRSVWVFSGAFPRTRNAIVRGKELQSPGDPGRVCECVCAQAWVHG